MEYKKNRHAYYKLTYHLVVVTKYRHKCISEKMMIRLKEIMRPVKKYKSTFSLPSILVVMASQVARMIGETHSYHAFERLRQLRSLLREL